MEYWVVCWAALAVAAADKPLEWDDEPVVRSTSVAAPTTLPRSLIGNRHFETPSTRAVTELGKLEEDERAAKPLRSRISAALGRVSSPVTRWLHAESSPAPERRPKVLAADGARPRRFTPEIEAINYLSRLDSNAYPEVIDSLLASLDDPIPSVRQAVLESLQRKCADRQHHCRRGTSFNPAAAVDCPACKSWRKVVTRLDSLLLEVDEQGRLKEQSERNRNLAVAMILALDSLEPQVPAMEFVSDRFAEANATKLSDPPRGEADLKPPPKLPIEANPHGVATPTKSRSKFFRWFESGNKTQEQETKSSKP